MSEKEVFEKLKGIIAEGLGIDKKTIKMESSFIDDLAADSLDIVELVMSIEDEFDVEISDEKADDIKTVADAVKAILEDM